MFVACGIWCDMYPTGEKHTISTFVDPANPNTKYIHAFEKVTARFYDTFSRLNFFQKFKVYAATFEQTLCLCF